MEDYVWALVFVQSRYVMATRPNDDLQVLFAEASRLRERLGADAHALSLRGLFDARKLAALRGANGYKNVANDLQALSAEMEAIWPQIQGKCATKLEELMAATQVSTRLTRVVGLRGQSQAVLAGRPVSPIKRLYSSTDSDGLTEPAHGVDETPPIHFRNFSDG